MRPRILFLVPADYEELVRKGTDRMIQDRDEGGFFERVVTVHPLASQARIIDLNPVHRIHEFPLGQALGSRASGLWSRISAPYRLLAMTAAMVRIARAERVDLVRANDPYLMGLIAWWVARSLGIPFCVSLHADYDKVFDLTPKRGIARWRRRAARALAAFVIPRARMLLPIRRHLIGPLERAGGRREAIQVIPHGIDLAPFSERGSVDGRALFGLAGDAIVVSFAGRLSGENYAADLADIVGRVARRHRGVTCVLVGEGPDEPMVRRLLDTEGARGNVKLLPFQPYERVIALRRVSTASLCLMGGFSLIEACAAGSPPIAYDVEWHRELVQDGVSGFLVPEHDVDAAVAALEVLIADPDRAAAMGREARRAAFEQHDVRITSKIKQACYTRLLNGQGAAAG